MSLNIDLTARRLCDNSEEYDRKQWRASIAVAHALIWNACHRKPPAFPSSLHDPVFTFYGDLKLQGRIWALHQARMGDLIEKFRQEESQEEEDWDDEETETEADLPSGGVSNEINESSLVDGDNLAEEYSDEEGDHRKYQPVEESGEGDDSESTQRAYRSGPPYKNAKISYFRHRLEVFSSKNQPKASLSEAISQKDDPVDVVDISYKMGRPCKRLRIIGPRRTLADLN